MNIFGNKDALIGSVELIIGAFFVLGALVFRKSVANNALGCGFSVFGSTIPGILGFIIANNFFSTPKFPVLIGLVLFFAGGFLLSEIIGDGYSES